MVALYQAQLIGAGTSMDSYRPGGFGFQADGSYAGYQTLFTSAKRSPNTIVISDHNNVVASGVLKLDEAPTRRELGDKLQARPITQQERNQMNQFLGQGNQAALPPEITLWWDALHFASVDLNPAINLYHLFYS